jgi:quercetin dioxygenase-like cupin family protein
MQSAGHNVADMSFAPLPGLPSCVQGSVQNGDPSKSGSIIFAKASAGCVIPWHWHTPNEHVMMVSGAAHVEMKDGTPFTLKAGGFALLPSKHVHQFRCEKVCQLYIYSDTVFDIHYVNEEGKDLTLEDALEKVKKATATTSRR